jgi:hypothetical protein
MRYSTLLLAAGLVLAGAGCSNAPPEFKAEEKPRFMRQMVLHSVRLAREQPNAVERRSFQFIDKLKDAKLQAEQDHVAIYEELIQKYQELAEAAKRSPGSADVNKKLGELSDLARKLPL